MEVQHSHYNSQGYLITAYSVSIFKDTFNHDAINNLVINRRYFGLSFSISHSVHLVALIYFFYTSSKAYLLHHQFDELKELDRKIVLNSMILKWDVVKKEFKERLKF